MKLVDFRFFTDIFCFCLMGRYMYATWGNENKFLIIFDDSASNAYAGRIISKSCLVFRINKILYERTEVENSLLLFCSNCKVIWKISCFFCSICSFSKVERLTTSQNVLHRIKEKKGGEYFQKFCKVQNMNDNYCYT